MICIHGIPLERWCSKCGLGRTVPRDQYLPVPRQLAALVEAALTIEHPGLTKEQWRRERANNIAQALDGAYVITQRPEIP